MTCRSISPMGTLPVCMRLLVLTLSCWALAVAAQPRSVLPRVAWVLTRPGETQSEVRVQAVEGTEAPKIVGRFSHLPDAAIRATALPGTTQIAVVADVLRTRDGSFAAGLFSLGDGTT